MKWLHYTGIPWFPRSPLPFPSRQLDSYYAENAVFREGERKIKQHNCVAVQPVTVIGLTVTQVAFVEGVRKQWKKITQLTAEKWKSKYGIKKKKEKGQRQAKVNKGQVTPTTIGFISDSNKGKCFII